MVGAKANAAICVTSGSYTPDAIDFSRDKPIKLIDVRGLAELLRTLALPSSGRIALHRPRRARKRPRRPSCNAGATCANALPSAVLGAENRFGTARAIRSATGRGRRECR